LGRASADDLVTKYGILTASYRPGPTQPDPIEPYDTMTSINTFPVALSHYWTGGWTLLLRGASPALGEAFAHGYRVAMFTGAGLALLGAWASLARPKT